MARPLPGTETFLSLTSAVGVAVSAVKTAALRRSPLRITFVLFDEDLRTELFPATLAPFLKPGPPAE